MHSTSAQRTYTIVTIDIKSNFNANDKRHKRVYVVPICYTYVVHIIMIDLNNNRLL